MPPFTKPDASRASLSDRRTSHRGPVQTRARLTVLDGPSAGAVHEILARDMPMAGMSFLLRESLAVGQLCQLEFQPGTRPVSAEIVRSRPISGGRYEMALQLRK
ncbi:MAG TPA: PilZ domain-containing protein [Tepidisphaeraceae bacterium]